MKCKRTQTVNSESVLTYIDVNKKKKIKWKKKNRRQLSNDREQNIDCWETNTSIRICQMQANLPIHFQNSIEKISTTHSHGCKRTNLKTEREKIPIKLLLLFIWTFGSRKRYEHDFLPIISVCTTLTHTHQIATQRENILIKQWPLNHTKHARCSTGIIWLTGILSFRCARVCVFFAFVIVTLPSAEVYHKLKNQHTHATMLTRKYHPFGADILLSLSIFIFIEDLAFQSFAGQSLLMYLKKKCFAKTYFKAKWCIFFSFCDKFHWHEMKFQFYKIAIAIALTP